MSNPIQSLSTSPNTNMPAPINHHRPSTIDHRTIPRASNKAPSQRTGTQESTLRTSPPPSHPPTRWTAKLPNPAAFLGLPLGVDVSTRYCWIVMEERKLRCNFNSGRVPCVFVEISIAIFSLRRPLSLWLGLVIRYRAALERNIKGLELAALQNLFISPRPDPWESAACLLHLSIHYSEPAKLIPNLNFDLTLHLQPTIYHLLPSLHHTTSSLRISSPDSAKS
ncbi:hypothetical protein EYC80_003807 [Monilinia laxa]|uniref:Uncharacterized protein n=1 Tax=Monilinia laxa TaxID=61186 RepID=A0A5N6KKT7_MONLA|nr:hypothetical protein EYC80_003807 [Monilinia laxa]